MTPRPKCETCGKVTGRVQTTAGKGVYKCTNSQCSNFMKKAYIRASKDPQKKHVV